jgi:hypothetical protein
MAAWIAIGSTVLLWLVSIAQRYGVDENRMKNIENELLRGFKYHDEHFAHKQDTDRHFSPRERDDLEHRMRRYEETQQEILREVRNIGKGLNDKG